MLYRCLTTLARALAQYLLVFPKLPGRLHLPPEKEKETAKFVVMTLEVGAARELGVLCGGKCGWPHHAVEERGFHWTGRHAAHARFTSFRP